MTTIIEHASKYCGVLEQQPNRGPLLDKWKGWVSRPLELRAIPWCTVFLYVMLIEFNNLWKPDGRPDKNALAAVLGWDPQDWWPESADSWRAKATPHLLREPTGLRAGDIFLLMRLTAQGYSTTDAIHGGFVAADVDHLQSGSRIPTLEGNTVAEGAIGSTREGTSVAARHRTWRPGAYLILPVAESLRLHEVSA